MDIFKYRDFLFESDEVKRETFKEMPLFISKELKKLFQLIKSPISYRIIKDDEEKINQFSISFLDYEVNPSNIDKITFLPANKVNRGLLSSTHINPTESFEAKGRQEISIGKIVNKLYPNTFTQNVIDEFINDFKAELAKSFSKFELVEGEDIRHFYLENNYENSNQGDMNSSCMRYKNTQKFLDIYVNNPEKCKLLILKSDKIPGKIKGRAIVWMGTRKPNDRVYMDRIYTLNIPDQKLYIDYAIEHGWLYKAGQVMHDASYIDKGQKVYSSVAIQLKPKKYDLYPSMDTLQYYTPSTGRLGSVPGNDVPGHPRYHLNSADGGAQKLDK